MAILKSLDELSSSTPPAKKVRTAAKQEFLKRKDVKRQNIPDILERKGVRFTKVDPNGAQLLVNNGEETIEYWPGAGRWTVRKVGGRTGYTLQGLLEYLEVE